MSQAKSATSKLDSTATVPLTGPDLAPAQSTVSLEPALLPPDQTDTDDAPEAPARDRACKSRRFWVTAASINAKMSSINAPASIAACSTSEPPPVSNAGADLDAAVPTTAAFRGRRRDVSDEQFGVHSWPSIPTSG